MRKANLPEREIRFAAKAGFLTRRLWEDFFAEGTPSWRRRTWKYFVERGLFRPHPSALAVDVLVLNRRNPVVMSLVGDDISTAPFISQLEHDATVARILLDLSNAKIIRSFVTEMEIKREIKDQRRFEGGTVKMKYPDAIVKIGGPTATVRIALELELSRKEPKRYRQCLDAYATRKDIDKVIFIARPGLIFDSLKRAMRETHYPDWERPIGFGRLEDWKRSPCSAVIEFSESMTTLAAIHQKIVA